jgi:hypothetical protein
LLQDAQKAQDLILVSSDVVAVDGNASGLKGVEQKGCKGRGKIFNFMGIYG